MTHSASFLELGVANVYVKTEVPGGFMVDSPIWLRNGENFIEGVPGKRYEIVVSSRSYNRIEVVMSVDGIDIQDGETASISKKGLVIPTYSTYTFNGRRISLEETATFRFGTPEQSYAAKTGRPNNIGLIGLAIYSEYESPKPTSLIKDFNKYPGYDIYCRSGGEHALKSVGGSLGTTFGERRVDRVGTTTFTRSVLPPVVVTIRYESAETLQQLGIPMQVPISRPNPFPADQRFTTPPSDWRG
jgi:hypothetical protein